MMSESPSTPVTDLQLHLANVVVDIERAAARIGWDHAPTLYALVFTQELLGQPDLPADLEQQLRSEWDGSATHLSAIIQEDLPSDELEDLLAHIAWPNTVAGAAITVERLIVPPHVEAEAPEDPDEAVAFISQHPERNDVRLAVGVLRTGESWCALRARSFDSEDKVGQGSQLVPGLVEALAAAFAE